MKFLASSVARGFPGSPHSPSGPSALPTPTAVVVSHGSGLSPQSSSLHHCSMLERPLAANRSLRSWTFRSR